MGTYNFLNGFGNASSRELVVAVSVKPWHQTILLEFQYISHG